MRGYNRSITVICYTKKLLKLRRSNKQSSILYR
nr:MAG TPA: hypothetical protein [Bacteriophage sp.]